MPALRMFMQVLCAPSSEQILLAIDSEKVQMFLLIVNVYQITWLTLINNVILLCKFTAVIYL